MVQIVLDDGLTSFSCWISSFSCSSRSCSCSCFWFGTWFSSPDKSLSSQTRPEEPCLLKDTADLCKPAMASLSLWILLAETKIFTFELYIYDLKRLSFLTFTYRNRQSRGKIKGNNGSQRGNSVKHINISLFFLFFAFFLLRSKSNKRKDLFKIFIIFGNL